MKSMNDFQHKWGTKAASTIVRVMAHKAVTRPLTEEEQDILLEIAEDLEQAMKGVVDGC